MTERSRSKSPITRRRLYITQAESTISDIDIATINKNDETNEVSQTLHMVRKLHDQTSNENQKKRQQVERLRKEVEQAQQISSQTQSEHRNLQNKIEQLQNQLTKAKTKYDEEVKNKKVYLHVLDRMKQDKVATERTAQSLKRNLKSATQVLSQEADKLRKTKEINSQSKLAIQQLKNSIENEKKFKQQRINQLEKTLKLRQEITSRREERNKRQADIVLAATELDKNSQEYKNREALFLNRFWYKVLVKKLEREQQRARVLEKAFQQIKNATGFKEINEIVQRFLTREKTYTELMESVKSAEEKLNTLKEDNAKAREQLIKIQLVGEGQSNIEFHKQMQELEDQIHEENKALVRDEEKYRKISEVHDRGAEWTNKIMQKLDIEGQAPTSLQMDSQSETLADCLNKIADKLEEMVGELKTYEAEGNEDIWKIPHDLQPDFSAELLQKNIRFTQRPEESDDGGLEVKDELIRKSELEQLEEEEKARYNIK